MFRSFVNTLCTAGGRKTRRRRRRRKKRARTHKKRRRKKTKKISKKALLKQINHFMERDDFHHSSPTHLNKTIIVLLENIIYMKLEKNETAKQFLDFIIDLGVDQGNSKIYHLYNELASAYFK